jgi:hypothetical protein
LRDPAPVMRRRAGLHRCRAGRLLGQKRRHPRPRRHPVVQVRPIRSDRADMKAPFARSIASMLIFVVIDAPSARLLGSPHGIRDASGRGHPWHQLALADHVGTPTLTGTAAPGRFQPIVLEHGSHRSFRFHPAHGAIYLLDPDTILEGPAS